MPGSLAVAHAGRKLPSWTHQRRRGRRSKRASPRWVIGVRRLRVAGGGVEVPGYVHVEREGATFDEVASCSRRSKTLYLQLVQQLAEAGGIPEQEFHNKIAEHMDAGHTDGNEADPADAAYGGREREQGTSARRANDALRRKFTPSSLTASKLWFHHTTGATR